MSAVPRTVILLLVCAACAPAATTTTTVSRSVRAVEVGPGMGSLAAFVAAVPPFEEGGECKTFAHAPGRLVTLRFEGPGGARRSVALDVDARGRVVHYSDVRGDLESHGTGPRTSVTVDLENDAGTAMNEHGGARGTPGLTL